MTTLLLLCALTGDWNLIDARVSDLEARVAALESKATASKSADCTCINCKCDPCTCGVITVRSPSFACPACDQAKAWLDSQGKPYRAVIDDTLGSWPQFDVCEDGQCKRISSQTQLRQMLAPETYRNVPQRTVIEPRSTTVLRAIQYTEPTVSYSQPTVSYRRGLFGRVRAVRSSGGGSYSSGSCSTCR